jgi:hypothetical protein
MLLLYSHGSALFPWAAGCQLVALNCQQVNLFFSYIPMDLLLPWVAGYKALSLIF